MSFWQGFGPQKSDLDEEIATHLRMAIADRVARGESAEEARAAAEQEMGNLPLAKDVTREMWGWVRMERLVQDFKYALRQMRRSPGFAATVIGTLALGIGAAAAMFTVVDHVLLRPLPYKDAARLVVLQEGGRTENYFYAPWTDIEQWRSQNRSFEDIAFSTQVRGRTYLQGNSAALQVDGEEVSPNLFAMLGAKTAQGRGFVAEQPSFGSTKNIGTIVLSDAVWHGAFGGDRNILGRVVRVNDEPYSVVGVMPPGFRYPAPDSVVDGQVWMALQLGPKDQGHQYDSGYYEVIARLRRGFSVAAATAEMATIQKGVAAQYKDAEERDAHSVVRIQRYGDSLIDTDVKKALLALLAAAGVLWLIASVNVTNLLLARSTARQREIAMRGALGASRGRVLQQMVIEGLVLSGCAAVLGVGLALGAIRLTAAVAPIHLNVDFSTHVDFTILAVLCGLTLLSAVVSSAWPALVAVRAPIEPALKQGGQQTGAGRKHNRLRSGLVAVEVAMSLTLLVACGLLLRTIYTLRHVPLGYRTDHIVVANLSVPSYRYVDQSVTSRLYQPLLERAQHLPGVQAAGLMSEVPLGQTFNITLTLRMNGNSIAAGLKTATPDMQKIFGMKMLAGRFFNDQDTPTSQGVALVNPAFAAEYAPDKHDPKSLLGMKVWNLRKDMPALIVGVLDNERQKRVNEPSQPEVEVCLCQITPASGIYQPTTVAMDLAVRSNRAAVQMIPEMRDLLRQASPELANSTFSTMDQIVEDSFGSQRLAADLLEVFGGAALLLCVGGLYGLLAYVVTQRTREMGVRIALGAQRGNLLWLVMRQAGVMLLVGVVIGLGLALASGRLVGGFLYGVEAHDGWTLAGAAVLLFLSGMLAAYLPARRAARVNPIEALRAD
jgi:predicted permease